MTSRYTKYIPQLVALREHRVHIAQRQVFSAKRALVAAKEESIATHDRLQAYQAQRQTERLAMDKALMGQIVRPREIEKTSAHFIQTKITTDQLKKTSEAAEHTVTECEKTLEQQRYHLIKRLRAKQKIQQVHTLLTFSHRELCDE